MFGDNLEVEEILRSFGFEEIEIKDCFDEEVKRFFEKSVLVEVL